MSRVRSRRARDQRLPEPSAEDRARMARSAAWIKARVWAAMHPDDPAARSISETVMAARRASGDGRMDWPPAGMPPGTDWRT